LIKSDLQEQFKTIYISDKLFWTFYPSKNTENIFNIGNNNNKCPWAPNQHENDFWRITWHWSNDAENI